MRHHCGRFANAPLTRREMLSRTACGFGAVALTALLSEAGIGRTTTAAEDKRDLFG